MFQPLLSPKRYKGAYGGRGSAKSHFFAELAIETQLRNPGSRGVCIREVQHSLKESVKRLIEDKIQSRDIGDHFNCMETEIRSPGDGLIIFQGMQNHTAETIKSLEGYDWAWVEEAQSLSARSLMLLRPTIRRPNSELWFSWNPKNSTDPVDALLRGDDRPENSAVVQVSYHDNPWFPDVLREEMEYDKRRDPDRYAHVWLGEYERHSEARVFHNWRIGAPDEFEQFILPGQSPTRGVTTIERFYFGADWGFSVDPTVLIRCFILGRTLYVDREVHKIGCDIDHTPALFDRLENGMARNWPIRADSARPETISYMRQHGYPRIVAARKGPGSVEEGVEFLKSYDIVVHPDCVHTVDELTMYSYKVDKKSEQVLPVLDDKKNHVIDALRYAVEDARPGIKGVARMW